MGLINPKLGKRLITRQSTQVAKEKLITNKEIEMLEEKIELLTKAIIDLTARMDANIPPTKEDKIIAEKLTETPEVTAQQVKELAKKKMADGVKRTTIKDLIVELKAESIADLDDEGLASLYKSLEEIS